jgi:DNA modification methylase
MFGGSGATLIGCGVTGRVCRMIEIDPRYCDVIRRRWTRWAKEHGKTVGRGALE